jgi:hypothetical protein
MEVDSNGELHGQIRQVFAMSVFQYTAEAYRLLLTLVDLIVKSMFEPLRFLTVAALLLGIGGGLWFVTFWFRRRGRAGAGPRS